MQVLIRQGGSNERMLLSCIVGNVGFGILGGELSLGCVSFLLKVQQIHGSALTL